MQNWQKNIFVIVAFSTNWKIDARHGCFHVNFAKKLAISFCRTPPRDYFWPVKKFFLPINFHWFFQQQYLQYFSDVCTFLHCYIITDSSRLLALELLFVQVQLKSVILFVYCLYSSFWNMEMYSQKLLLLLSVKYLQPNNDVRKQF